MNIKNLLKKSVVFVAVNAASGAVQTYVSDKLKEFMDKRKQGKQNLAKY